MRHALTLLFPVLLSACMGGGEQQWIFEDVLAVDAALSNGELRITSEDRPNVVVDWAGGGVGRKAVHPDLELVDGVLTVDAMAGLLSGGELDVVVPLQMSVRGRVSRGELAVDLLAPAHVDACVAAGDLNMVVPSGQYVLALNVGAGDIDVHDVVHSERADTVIHGCVAAGSISVMGE